MANYGDFHSNHYIRLNQRRQEHLVSLGLGFSRANVLELGAGIGDHATFFLDRDCEVLSLEVREENLARMSENIAGYYGFYESSRPRQHRAMKFDLEQDSWEGLGKFDIVYSYGVLYHVKEPYRVIQLMGELSQGLGLLETCVSDGEAAEVILTPEPVSEASQAFHGVGCRPSRAWVFNALKTVFPYVYMPLTQPNHEEFPLEWTRPGPENILARAVFVASVKPVDNKFLSESIPARQERCP